MRKNGMTELERYYNKFNEEHRLQTRHGRVEFNTTMHYILKFAEMLQVQRSENPCLSAQNSAQNAEKLHLANTIETAQSETATNPVSNADKNECELKILDVGAGTGRYSIALLEKGFDVTAVELVKRNLEILRSKGKPVKTWQGDAMNLNFLEDKTFDITLLLGPMYHLGSKEKKLRAFSEALRVTKDDGLIFVGYCMNEYAILKYCFEENRISALLENGSVTKDFKTVSSEHELYSYSTLSDIDELNEKAGTERVTIFASDGPSDYMRRELNAMNEQTFAHFLDFVLKISERPDLLGASSHTVDIVKKA